MSFIHTAGQIWVYGSIFDLLSNIHWNSLSYECWLRGVGWWLSPIIPSPNTFDTFNIQLDFHKTKCMGSGCAKERLQMKITFACRACFRSIANKNDKIWQHIKILFGIYLRSITWTSLIPIPLAIDQIIFQFQVNNRKGYGTKWSPCNRAQIDSK